MHPKKFSEYTPTTSATGNEIMPIVKGGANTVIRLKDLPISLAIQAALDAGAAAGTAALAAHVNDTNNPHAVTKAQVGLGNASNTSDADKPVSIAQAQAIAVVQSDIDAHQSDLSNPHSVTKAQVGLPNVDNTTDAAKPISAAQQAALDGKQPLDTDLTVIAALAPQNNDLIQRKAGAWINVSPAQLKSDLGLVKSDVGLGNVDNTSDANKPISTAAQSALNSKQPLDSDLTSLSAIDPVNDDIIQRKAGAWINRTPAQFKLDLALVKSDVGLGSVDNTSDVQKWAATATFTNKSISGSTNTFSNIPQSAIVSLSSDLALKAPLASPALTGAPTAPTAALGTNTTQLANTAFVRGEISALVAAAPGTLDTLNELATALGNDPNFATTITTSIAGKQPLNAKLTALSAVNASADTFAFFTGANTMDTAAVTAFARTLLGSTNEIAARALLKFQDRSSLVVGPNSSQYKTDGTADQVEINQAIADLSAAGGGTVWLENIHFYTTDTIVYKSNVLVRGQGMGVTFIHANISTTKWALNTNTTGQSKTLNQNIWAADFTIVCETACHSSLISNTTNAGYLRVETYHRDQNTAIREALVLQHCKYAYSYDTYQHDCTGNGVQINGCDYFDVRGNRVTNFVLFPIVTVVSVDATADSLNIGDTTNYQTGQRLSLIATGTNGVLPAPLVAGTTYFAIRIDAMTIKLATTSANATAGTAIDLTDVGTGTFLVRPNMYHMDDMIDIDEDFLDTHTVPSRYGFVHENFVDGSTNGNGTRIASSQYVFHFNNFNTNHYGAASADILINSYGGTGHPPTFNVFSHDNYSMNSRAVGYKVLNSGATLYNVFLDRNYVYGAGINAPSGQVSGALVISADGVYYRDNTFDTSGKAGSADGGSILYFKSSNVNGFGRRNTILNSPGAPVRFWNGDNLQSYTNIDVEDTVTQNSASGWSVPAGTTFKSGKRNQGLNPEIAYVIGNITGNTTITRVNGDFQTATMTGNVTLSLTNGIVVGDRITLVLTQDATGSRTMVWGSNVKLAYNNTLVLTTTPAAVDLVTLVWDGTNWREVSRQLDRVASIVEGGTAASTASAARTNLGAEAAITAGTTAQYWRGDKTFQTLDKTAVGLPNVDNTSDANKPVSTATQTALNAKQPLSTDLTAIAGLTPVNDDILQRKAGAWINRTPAQFKTDLALTKTDVGLSNVPNVDATSRANHTGTQTASTISDFNASADARISAQKGAANGLATLGSDSKIPTSQLPALAITSSFVVASQAAQLALVAEEGDIAIRSDLNKSYVRNAGTAGTMADWNELLTPTNAVLSVNGQTGAVVLSTSNIAEGSNLYYTNARADARIAAAVGVTVQAYNAATTLLGNTTTGTGGIVLSNSPTIVTPTIASFVNAGHTHENAAGGGQISLTAAVTGVLPLANGGTGSVTQNFVDLTNAQNVAGEKVFTNRLTVQYGGPVIQLIDTGQTAPAGVYQWQNFSDSLRIYRGVFGVSASEKFRLDSNGIVASILRVQTQSGGVFTGTNVVYFGTTGDSYLNNGGKFGINTTTPTSTFQNIGSAAPGAYTITNVDLTLTVAHHTVEVTAASIITLPTAASIQGREYIVINATAASINVVSSVNIGNSASATTTYPIPAGGAVNFKSNGTVWRAY